MLRTAEDAKQSFLFRITPGNVKTVGRAPRADFVVDAALVSRLHCRLAAGAAEIEATDLKSTNGTYVNGARVDRATLRDGDRLRVGAVELLVVKAGSELERQGVCGASEPAQAPRPARSYRRNGFVRRSRPIVVGSPWPEYTTESSG